MTQAKDVVVEAATPSPETVVRASGKYLAPEGM